MRFTEASGRKVVSTSTAETVGHISEFVVDPQSHSVVALILKKSGDGDTLLWSAITAFGDDAVTVAGAEVVTESNPALAALSGKDKRVLGKRVLTAVGEDLGEVVDVYFDPASGAIAALVVPGGELAGESLIGIGSYAVIVHPAP
jgi:uncharacterized protein YrrD